MSASGAGSSTVNQLHLEPPRSAEDIYNDTYPDNDSVEIQEPTCWLRQLVHQHRQAQTDLQRLRQICGGEYDQSHRRIRSIERNYESIFQSVR